MGFKDISTEEKNEEDKSYWKAEWKSFHEEFGKETDRAAVILAAAKIDELLS